VNGTEVGGRALMQLPERDHLKRFNSIMLTVVLIFGVMYFAQDFLIPLTLSLLIATLLVPFCRWMERKGLARGLAATLSAIAVLIVLSGVFAFIAFQVSSFSKDVPQLKEKLTQHLSKGQEELETNFGVTITDMPLTDSTASDSSQASIPIKATKGKSEKKAAAEKKEEKATTEENGAKRSITMSEAIQHFITVLKFGFGTMFTLVIMFAYIVLFLYYRRRLRDAVIMIFPEHRKERTKHALREAGRVGQSYLGGMFVVTTILGVLNSIALLAIGIDHPFLFGFLAGYLNFIPFIGTLMGGLLPMAMALLTEDSALPALLVVGAFALNQVIEETMLTPKIVGNRVNVNPLFIIFAIVIGELIWGIPGVILFIPLTAIAKIIFDHVEELKPLAHFLGQQEEERPTIFRKLKMRLKSNA
jgi:predicted PurR-regulated permease PerM